MAKDFRTKMFQKTLRGYASEEVDSYLAYINEEYRKLERRYEDCEKKLALAVRRVAELSESLDSANETAEAMKTVAARLSEPVNPPVSPSAASDGEAAGAALLANAQTEADRLLSEAKVHANQLLTKAKQRALQILDHADQVRLTAEEEALRIKTDADDQALETKQQALAMRAQADQAMQLANDALSQVSLAMQQADDMKQRADVVLGAAKEMFEQVEKFRSSLSDVSRTYRDIGVTVEDVENMDDTDTDMDTDAEAADLARELEAIDDFSGFRTPEENEEDETDEEYEAEEAPSGTDDVQMRGGDLYIDTGDEPLEDEPLEDEPLEDEPLEDEPLEDEPLEDEPEEDGAADSTRILDLGILFGNRIAANAAEPSNDLPEPETESADGADVFDWIPDNFVLPDSMFTEQPLNEAERKKREAEQDFEPEQDSDAEADAEDDFDFLYDNPEGNHADADEFDMVFSRYDSRKNVEEIRRQPVIPAEAPAKPKKHKRF